MLGLRLPAVVGVQSASSPPRYVAMARLRQAMTEASIETLEVSVEPPAAGSKLVSLARPAPQGQATIIEGDAAGAAAQIVELLCERGWSGADGRRPRLRRIAGQRPAAGLRRPLAEAAGGDLWCFSPAVSRTPRRRRPRRTWCSRHRTRRSRPIARGAPGGARGGDQERAPELVVLENTTAGLDLAAAAAAATGLASSATASSWRSRTGGAIDQRHLRRTAARHRSHAAAGGGRVTTALHTEPQAAGAASARGARAPAELESLRTEFVEPVVPRTRAST